MATTLLHDNPAVPRQTPLARLSEVLLIVLVFFVVAGDPPPHVNEAHYLARLKHTWNPTWCAGDLFLESKEAQLVFVGTFGWLTRWLSLTATAWVGRLVAWTIIAWGWQRLSWRVVPIRYAAVLSAALFVSFNVQAQLAGEWIVGGIEAKCIAYGFALFALTDWLNHRWNRMWLLLGAATAFHPIVGGWISLLCGVTWFWEVLHTRVWRASLLGLAGFAILAAIGIVPALRLTWNENREVVDEASRIYVFERLPHHLALLSLPTDEITRRVIRHGVLLGGLCMLAGMVRTSATRRLAFFAAGAVVLALVGFAIEFLFRDQPLVAARFLRYYWFRMSDFAVPLATALLLTAQIGEGELRRRPWAPWLLTAALGFAVWHVTSTARARLVNPVPPADARIRDLAAWEDACQWAAANTPADARFLTPRLNHSFKWRAGRPEIVTRKDLPQDARSIVEWHARLRDIYSTRFGDQQQTLDSVGALGTNRVRELAEKYRADYVLTDRTQLLSLPRAYWNEEYVIYRIEPQPSADGQ